MINEMNEMHRDPELRDALRLIESDPPLAEVDWEALRSSIVARAEIPLARRRTHSARLSRVTRSLVPLAAAASIALAVWITDPTARTSSNPTVADNRPDVAAPSITPEDIFQAEMTDQEFELLVSGRANADALLQIAIDES